MALANCCLEVTDHVARVLALLDHRRARVVWEPSLELVRMPSSQGKNGALLRATRAA